MQQSTRLLSPKTLIVILCLLVISYLLLNHLATEEAEVDTMTIVDREQNQEELDQDDTDNVLSSRIDTQDASLQSLSTLDTSEKADKLTVSVSKEEAALFELDQEIDAQNSVLTELIQAYDEDLANADKQGELSRALANADYKDNILQKFKLESNLTDNQ